MANETKATLQEKRLTSEEDSVRREMKIHGQRWESFHHRYFSDPKVAEPLTAAILSAVDAARPQVIADLGGGTGFLLKELLRRRPLEGVRLVDVDVSDRQLSACNDERIERLAASAATFARQDLVAEDRRLLLVARSLLHYFGESGLLPLLRHLRGQLFEGELFVHQSACFADDGDAACLNRVYEMMKTEKWYFTIGELEAALEKAGFLLCEVRAAPPLRLDSCDLAERYELSAAQVASIREVVGQKFGERPGVFTSAGDGFTAWLHYSIFSCQAV
jgi:SAM-dependent methyltransferase